MTIIESFDRFLKTKIVSDVDKTKLIDLSIIFDLDDKTFQKSDYICLPYDECYFYLYRNIYVHIKEENAETYKITFVNDSEKVLAYHTLTLVLEKNKRILYNYPDEVDVHLLEIDTYILNLLFKLLNNISHSKHNLYVTTNFSFRYRDRENKISKNYKKPIFIYTTKKEADIKIINQKFPNIKVEKQISWNVRGHWRRLHNALSIGKDRAGEYVVSGFTWVKDFIKGNQNEKANNKPYFVK